MLIDAKYPVLRNFFSRSTELRSRRRGPCTSKCGTTTVRLEFRPRTRRDPFACAPHNAGKFTPAPGLAYVSSTYRRALRLNAMFETRRHDALGIRESWARRITFNANDYPRPLARSIHNPFCSRSMGAVILNDRAGYSRESFIGCGGR